MMRQLRTEGWIHHVAQQVVGCFLTRGCLWLSWEEGFKVSACNKLSKVNTLTKQVDYPFIQIATSQSNLLGILGKM